VTLSAAYQTFWYSGGLPKAPGRCFGHSVRDNGPEPFAVVKMQAAAGDTAEVVRFSSMASKTGTRFPGELLMTCKTSAVAVCCSKASRLSVSRLAFSIAITACAAKFCSSAICLSVNGVPPGGMR